MGTQREILSGAVLDLHQREVEEHLYAQPIGAVAIDAEPSSILTPQAEADIAAAASMIAAGFPAQNVLACLYLLAFMAGVARS